MAARDRGRGVLPLAFRGYARAETEALLHDLVDSHEALQAECKALRARADRSEAALADVFETLAVLEEEAEERRARRTRRRRAVRLSALTAGVLVALALVVLNVLVWSGSLNVNLPG